MFVANYLFQFYVTSPHYSLCLADVLSEFTWRLNFFIVLYCIVLYCIVLYCIVSYCIVLYCIVLYCIVLYCIVLYCIVLSSRKQ